MDIDEEEEDARLEERRRSVRKQRAPVGTRCEYSDDSAKLINRTRKKH